MKTYWWPIILSPLAFGAGVVLPGGWGVVPIAGLYAYTCILLVFEVRKRPTV